MKITKEVLLLAIVLVFSFSSVSFGAEYEDPHDPRTIYYERYVNPRGTYLRTCQDTAAAPTTIPIINIGGGVTPGDWVVFRRMGFFSMAPGYADNRSDMVGVFSAHNTIKPDEVTTQNRLRDGIEADKGYHFETQPTVEECVEEEGEEPKQLSSDIPHDFFISSNALQIPSDARYIYLSTNSGEHGDNNDPNLDFKLRFTDEVIWEGRALDNSWSTRSNWDTWYVPIPEFGVTFNHSGHQDVYNADSIIKYVRILAGTVNFQGGANLETTVCEVSKDSFVVDGAKVYFSGGRLRTCRIKIGSSGLLDVNSGASVKADSPIELNGGTVSVHGDSSLIDAYSIYIGGLDYGGSLNIFNKGIVDSATLIRIGGGNLGVSLVTVDGFGSWLRTEGLISIQDHGYLQLKNEGGIQATQGIFVYEEGHISGCYSGEIWGLVTNDGGYASPGCVAIEPSTNMDGDVEPGSSAGKLIIDGDYIQKTGGTLLIEVGGYQQEEDYDALEVTGDVTLDGTIQLDFINGFSPKKGDVFEFLIIGGTATGSFSNVVINGLGDGFRYDISIEEGGVKLTALNDGDTNKFPWGMFLPAFIGSEK